MKKTVLILGTSGKIGSHSARAFAAAGWKVRLFDRKADDMVEAAKDCDVIVNGMNPANYANWEVNIPAITKQVIAAAKASGALVIIPGNIYNYGQRTGELNEETAQAAETRKGRIRIEMEQAYRDAEVQTLVLRAGNFICPEHNSDVMSLLVLREASKHKIAYAGSPDAKQAYAYVPDWARAAVMLAEKRMDLEPFEDIPFPGHAFTINELRGHLEQSTGESFKLTAFPWWLMQLASPFWKLAYEMLEMRYLYNMHHWIGRDRFDRLLPGFKATSLAEVMEAGLPTSMRDAEA